MRRDGLIGGTVAVVLVVLIGHNVYRAMRLQREESCDYTLCLRPDNLADLAAENPHPSIRGRIAFFHRLAETIPGATVTIPPWLEEHRWSFERVARVRVVVAAAPMLVDPAALGDDASFEHRWLRSSHRRREEVWQPLRAQLDGGGDYVIAESEDGTALFLIPAARYREAARR